MCIVQTHRYESASIKAHPAGLHGVVQIDYFGVFSDEAAQRLMPLVRAECERGRVHLARVDRALIACDALAAARKAFAGSRVPGAVVCRPEQLPAMRVICSELSASGTLRLAFLDYAEAFEWADRLAIGLARDESRQRPEHIHLTEELDRLLVVCQKDQPANQQMLSKSAGR
jgi:hypothetical protein